MKNSTDTKVFLDTNVIAYIFDSRDTAKQKKAKELFIELVAAKNCQISTQVLQELFNVLTRKLKYTKDDAERIVSGVMNLPVHQLTVNDIAKAMSISISSQFTIYDSLIVAAAQAEDCTVVYSEDLNDGQTVGGVHIINPFK